MLVGVGGQGVGEVLVEGFDLVGERGQGGQVGVGDRGQGAAVGPARAASRGVEALVEQVRVAAVGVVRAQPAGQLVDGEFVEGVLGAEGGQERPAGRGVDGVEQADHGR